MNQKREKIYCLAPWIHAHVDMQGKRRLCCQASLLPELADLNLDEFWNSPHLKQIRIMMLRGSAPPRTCQACLQDKIGESPPRTMFDNYRYLESKLRYATQPDGSFPSPPHFFDYRLSNKCNLQCRMCSPAASSKIEQAVLATQEEIDATWLSFYVKSKYHNPSLLDELLASIARGEVDRLYFATGEAIFQKNFWQIINYAIKTNQAANISIHYHTNLSMPSNTLNFFLNKIQYFKSIDITISIDAYAQTCQFIRDGQNWELFLTNLELLQQLAHSTVHLQLAITLTIPTLLNIREFITFLLKIRLPYTVNICFYDGLSKLLSPYALNRQLFDKLISHALDLLKQQQDSYLLPFIQSLQLFHHHPVAAESNKNWKKDLATVAQKTTELDQFFKRASLIQYYQDSPILRNWISEITNLKQHQQITYSLQQHRKITSNQQSLFVSHCYTTANLNHLIQLALEQHKDYISLIGSAPTWLNKRLSKNQQQKFQLYYDFTTNFTHIRSTFNQLSIHHSRYLGPFSFLQHNSRWTPKLGTFLDLLCKPLLPLLAFHYHVVIKIK